MSLASNSAGATWKPSVKLLVRMVHVDFVVHTVLDELLDTVCYKQIPIGVNVHDIASLEPAILGKRLVVELRSIPVALEDVWAFQEQLTGLQLR